MLRFRAAACLLAALFAPELATAGEDSLVPLTGRPVAAQVVSIDAQGQVHLASGAPVALDGLRRIERPVAVGAAAALPVRLHLNGGGDLAVTSVTVKAEACAVQWAFARDLNLPLAAVRGVQFAQLAADGKSAPPCPEFLRDLNADPAKTDALYVTADDKVQVVQGFLQEIAADKVTFLWNDQPRSVLRKKVLGVLLAPTRERTPEAGRFLARLKDGSNIRAAAVALDKGALRLGLAGGREITVPWDSVTRLEVRSDRVLFLSDLDPVEARQEAWVSFPGPWRRDRSALNRPLTLHGQVFEKGLGVNGRCHLTWACRDGYNVFAAVVGIDDETAGKGDCIVFVVADGKEVFKQRLTAKDKPVPIQLPLNGVQRLTLAVEPGEDLDLGDHVDWCDARFTRESATEAKP